MFQMLSNAYAVNVLNGSMMLGVMLWGVCLAAIAVHYIAVFGYQWINDKENEEGSRWLLFDRFDKFFDYDVVNYVMCGMVLGSIVVPPVLGFLIAAVLTVPWLFAVIMSLLAIMKLTRGIVRLKKKLNTHINDDEAHKEK